eukprot:jgi/Ulvmu1/5449/UM224_0004.1
MANVCSAYTIAGTRAVSSSSRAKQVVRRRLCVRDVRVCTRASSAEREEELIEMMAPAMEEAMRQQDGKLLARQVVTLTKLVAESARGDTVLYDEARESMGFVDGGYGGPIVYSDGGGNGQSGPGAPDAGDNSMLAVAAAAALQDGERAKDSDSMRAGEVEGGDVVAEEADADMAVVDVGQEKMPNAAGAAMDAVRADEAATGDAEAEGAAGGGSSGTVDSEGWEWWEADGDGSAEGGGRGGGSGGDGDGGGGRGSLDAGTTEEFETVGGVEVEGGGGGGGGGGVWGDIFGGFGDDVDGVDGGGDSDGGDGGGGGGGGGGGDGGGGGGGGDGGGGGGD